MIFVKQLAICTGFVFTFNVAAATTIKFTTKPQSRQSTTKASKRKAAKPLSRKKTRSLSSDSCRAQNWNDRRDLSKQEFVLKLSSMPREEIRQIAWGELLSQNPRPIFPFLFIYLAKTESNNLLAGYYEGVLYMMNQTIEWREVAEQWPQHVDLHQLNQKFWTLTNLCREYKMAAGEI